VTAMRRDDPRDFGAGRIGQASSASTLAAQMKSLIEMPPTEWVL
jgi:hypothetical protein